jgi:hypothetical protein
MATIDELLASGGETAKLTVNLASRKIVVPPGIKNIGVESDDDVMCLPFSMPRYFGDVDLSEFDIRINYKNARGEGDVYLVNEFTTTDADTIEFDWIVGRYAVAYEGEVVFSLCLKKMDENNVVVKEFNTTICSLSVLKGLETDGAIIQENPDLINQMIDQASAEASRYLEDVVSTKMNQALDAILELQEGFIDKSKITYFVVLYETVHTCKADIGMTWAEAIASDDFDLNFEGFTIRENGYVACWVQNFIKKQDYAGWMTDENITEWGIKGTDKIVDGCVYMPSGVYDFDE